MLTIRIEGMEQYNDETEEFISSDPTVVSFEHSLVSLSKWESKHGKAFLSSDEKTPEELIDYLKMMIISPGVDPSIVYSCSDKDLAQLQEYIDSSQSATKFGEMPGNKVPGETITSELIYYWLVAFNIPFEAQTWHLNRLFALIRICNIKNSPPKKMSKNELVMRNRALNAQRKKELNTTG